MEINLDTDDIHNYINERKKTQLFRFSYSIHFTLLRKLVLYFIIHIDTYCTQRNSILLR